MKTQIIVNIIKLPSYYQGLRPASQIKPIALQRKLETKGVTQGKIS